MKLWIDDLRPAPSRWTWARSVHEAKIYTISVLAPEDSLRHLEVVSLDHDAGDYQYMGGDYINYLKWLEEFTHRHPLNDLPDFHIHTANPVGAMNMRAIIRANNWHEIFQIPC